MELIIIFLLLLTAYKWFPNLMAYALIGILFPVIPFYLAYTIRKTQPYMAITLVSLYGLLAILVLIVSCIQTT